MQLLNKKCNGAPVAARSRGQRVNARVVRVQATAAAEPATKTLNTTRSDQVRPKSVMQQN